MQADRNDIERRLGYHFQNPSLLSQALVHASRARRARNRALASNERMEFLGDRVLGLIIAERLFRAFPEEEEGALTRRQAALVRKESLAKIAGNIGVRRWLDVDNGDKSGAKNINDAMLADACEALIAAIYLDGGLEAARAFVLGQWSDMIKAMSAPPRDAKTALQEWAQQRGHDRPEYLMVERSGPAHAPEFVMTVSLGDLGDATARGGSKQAAEQRAAATLLEHLQKERSA